MNLGLLPPPPRPQVHEASPGSKFSLRPPFYARRFTAPKSIKHWWLAVTIQLPASTSLVNYVVSPTVTPFCGATDSRRSHDAFTVFPTCPCVSCGSCAGIPVARFSAHRMDLILSLLAPRPNSPWSFGFTMRFACQLRPTLPGCIP